MELNTKGRYAVMAMADLAKHGGGDAVALSAIAERQQLSVAYLEQIFSQLRRADLVASLRGRSGGYRLARPAGQITIAEIMIAVQEETRMTRCLDVEGEGLGCVGRSKCMTHDLWHALGDQIRSFLSGVTLDDVVERKPLRPPQAAAMPLPGGALPGGTATV